MTASPLRSRTLWLALCMVALLSGCFGGGAGAPTAQPAAPDANPASAAAVAAAQFVDAINRDDYTTAYTFLDANAQQSVSGPVALRDAYFAAYRAAGAITVTGQLRGVLEQGDQASAVLLSTWESGVIGDFQITTTVPLSRVKADAPWQVAWSQDVIVPGLSNGVLSVQRTVTPRGAILASDGTVLAEQSERMTLGVRRNQLVDADEEARMLAALSQLTGQSPADIRAKYADKPDDWFVPVADIDQDKLIESSALVAPFRAVIARPSYSRRYANADLAPHIVGWIGPISPEQAPSYRSRGYTGDEQVGQAGVEAGANTLLDGTIGGVLQVVTPGQPVKTVAERPFVRGQDVTLALSPTLQIAAQKLLGKRRGSVVMLDARTGGVLAMASYPTFDPAPFLPLDASASITDSKQAEAGRLDLLSDPDRPMLNRGTQTAYPAGSVFKMVTMAAGIGEGVTDPSDVFIDRGVWDGLGAAYRKTCWLRGGHGRLTLTQGLSASCNVVFYAVGKLLDSKGDSLLPDYARKFGFGAPTEVELIGEAPGNVPDPEWKQRTQGEVWTPGDTVNMAIGQGFLLVTPLQVAQMTDAIANGGTLRHPHFIAKVGGAVVPPTEVGKLPLTDAQLGAIQEGMIGVTQDARIGTAHFRFVGFDYYLTQDGQAASSADLTAGERATARKLIVAGKSGTAQAPGNAKPFAWFTAYAPAGDAAARPQVIVTVLLENIGEGSVFAAPVARQLIESYYRVPVSTTPIDVRESD